MSINKKPRYGAGLDVSSGTTTPALSLDLKDLTAATSLVGADDFIIVDGTLPKKFQVSNVNLSLMNNDLGNYGGWVTSSGVTSVTGGTGIDSSGGTTPSITLDLGELANTSMTVADDYIVFIDGSATGNSRKDKFADVVGFIAGTNLSASNGVLNATDTNTWRTVTAGGNTLASNESLDFVAGTNITISESAGNVTINSSGGGGSSAAFDHDNFVHFV